MATTSSFVNAVHDHLNCRFHLTPSLESIVGKPLASRREILDAITNYARENGLFKDPHTIRPNILLAVLLFSPKPIHIKDLNSRIARHLTRVD